MGTIAQQVALARRRLLIGQFVRTLGWTWCGAFLIAAAAIGAAKFWPPSASQSGWTVGWLFGAGLVGLAIAAVHCWRRRCSRLDAAVEIDRRFGLQERVATVVGLEPAELAGAMGQAIVRDASERVSRVRVADGFTIRPDRSLAAALAAALVATGVAWLAPAREIAQAAAATGAEAAQAAAKALEKKLGAKRDEARAEGLAEADELLKKLEAQTRGLAEQRPNEKQALIALNDLAKDLRSRREQLLAGEAVKQRLKQLDDLEHGPADKMAKALKQGDIKAAREALEKINQRLAANDLRPEERQKLAQQLTSMQKKLEAAADAHQQAQRDLEQQIAQQRRAGAQQAAERLQRQLDDLKQQAGAVEQLRPMAQKLGQAGQCLKEGACKAAQGQLAQLNDDLKTMEKAGAELAMLDDALDQVQDAKNSMHCQDCDGSGCKACRQGEAPGDAKSVGRGRGWGKGVAPHRGPEDNKQKGFFDSRVAQNVGAGAASVEGHARGPNRKGAVEEAIKESFESADRDAADPLTNQRLPRDYREHAKRYFESLREADH